MEAEPQHGKEELLVMGRRTEKNPSSVFRLSDNLCLRRRQSIGYIALGGEKRIGWKRGNHESTEVESGEVLFLTHPSYNFSLSFPHFLRR